MLAITDRKILQSDCGLRGTELCAWRVWILWNSAFHCACRFSAGLLITQYSQNPTQRFVPLGVTVYGNPPAFDLTEFGIWNFDVQRQFGNPDLHLQLGPQVTIREVQQHSDPSSHLLAIYIDVITPVWYLRSEKKGCQWWRSEKRTVDWSSQDTTLRYQNQYNASERKTRHIWIGLAVKSDVIGKYGLHQESALTFCQKLVLWFKYFLELWFKTKNCPQHSPTQI